MLTKLNMIAANRKSPRKSLITDRLLWSGCGYVFHPTSNVCSSALR